MATSAQQVEELAAQMKALALEKQRLEAQNRVLQHTVQLSSRHIQDTAAEKVPPPPPLSTFNGLSTCMAAEIQLASQICISKHTFPPPPGTTTLPTRLQKYNTLMKYGCHVTGPQYTF